MSDSPPPAQVFCLAEYLCEEMTERGWTTRDVAARMGTSRGAAKDTLILDLILAVSPVRDGMIIDDETFAGLARAFGTSDQLFRNMDSMWRKWPDRRSPFVCPEEIFWGKP